jgi:LPXTG-motif cell wall-anchored protein
MKKFALALMASAAMILGFGAVANAYPPGAGGATVSPTTASPGGALTITVSCAPGEDVTATLDGVTTAPVVCPASGSAVLSATAPTTAGTYTGTTNGSVNGALGDFSVTVAAPTGGLPATGSNSSSTITFIALGLFAVGAGLFGVSQYRRRTAAA